MAEQEQNRSEAATPFKLREAKKKGSVAKSMDLNSVFVIAAFLACLLLWSGSAAKDQLMLDAQLFKQAGSLVFTPAQVMSWVGGLLVATLLMLAPLFLALMAAGIASSLVQHGPVFSTHPIKPDFNRLNPMQGFKRIFAKRSLFDLLKNMFKLAVFGAVLYLSIKHLMPALLGLLSSDARTYGARLADDTSGLIFKLLLVMVGVALIDLVFTRWEFADKMRMSRREMKDEHKQREGDPSIKARIRELQNELRKKSGALKNVKNADVLVTNPTHIGVALCYQHGKMAAPKVVAKGSDDQVEKMKALARRHGVTIVENRRLARALYEVSLEATVPETHYAEVARILVWIQAARKRKTALAGSVA
jgi:flagellar biosynthesis protein FlhB